MLGIFGNLLLLLALVSSGLQSILSLIGYYRRNPYLLAFARPTAFAQTIFIAGAYFLLTIAFVINDFSITYVAANSHPTLPFMYRLTALWGAHEGSILLWIFILTIWTTVFAFTKQKEFIPLTLAVLGIISFCFLCFLLLTSNPFLPATELLSGKDLNPLLQDPGFVIHPPMLYAGYVGFSVTFAITQAALLRGDLSQSWARITRQFALAAWCFLTLGITLGSWWAYRVLGWGGFWFWDPVENASLLPWLSGTAFIHILLLVEKRHIGQAWGALLALISFALSLLGTFLVRSGVLISAHTFATDPKRGIFLLLLLAIVITAALALYVSRVAKSSHSSHRELTWFSREMMLLLNSALLITAMLTILLGTLYPLILDALGLGVISVGAPYFNKVMLPLILIVMVFMGLAPFLNWQNSPSSIWKKVIKTLLISIIVGVFLIWIFTQHFELIDIISLSLSIWIILSIIGNIKLLPGMSVAHFGFALLIIGIMLSSFLSQESEIRIKPGNATSVGPYQFFFLNVETANGANYRGVRADFEIIKNKYPITHLYPEKRIYNVREMVMTKVAIHAGIFRDIYIALGEPLEGDDWSVRIYYKPFIRFIWLGGLCMILGGLLAMRQRG